MSDTNTLITGLEIKIKKIVTLHQNLKEEKARLISEINELKQINNNQNTIIKNLKDKNELNTIASTINKTTDNKELHLKINGLVREIDNCIALLNK